MYSIPVNVISDFLTAFPIHIFFSISIAQRPKRTIQFESLWTVRLLFQMFRIQIVPTAHCCVRQRTKGKRIHVSMSCRSIRIFISFTQRIAVSKYMRCTPSMGPFLMHISFFSDDLLFSIAECGCGNNLMLFDFCKHFFPSHFASDIFRRGNDPT